MITLKSGREIALMRQAGVIAAKVFEKLQTMVKPGITTKELDGFAEKTVKKLGGTSAFLGYRGFPANICTTAPSGSRQPLV